MINYRQKPLAICKTTARNLWLGQSDGLEMKLVLLNRRDECFLEKMGNY